MKTKRFLLIALLSSALMLSSCDFLTQSKKSSKDKDDDDTQQIGDNFQADDYKGKSGATQLNESEWNKAFSLEETALHRSVKIAMKSTEKQQSYTMDMVAEIDHGKFKLSESYNNESYTFYIGVNSVSNGVATYTMYYPEKNGYRASEPSSGPIDLLMTEVGILNYKYQDFTYDSASKTYKADAFAYSMSSYADAGEYSSSSYYITNATIAIKDGFPSKIEFDVNTGESSVHFVANYSDYGKVVVTLPEQGGGNTPSSLGQEITSAQFIELFKKRSDNPYNHVDVAIIGDIENATGSATYAYGVWMVENGEVDSSTYEGLVLSEEALMVYVNAASSSSANMRFYHNSNNNTYSFTYEQESSGVSVSAIMTYNQYFCLVSEQAVIINSVYNLTVRWSNVPVPDYIDVAGSTFVGVDLEETDYEYYQGYKATTQGITIIFDKSGNFEMIITVVNSGNATQDYYLEYYGSYRQNGSSVTVNVNVATDGNQITTVPAEQGIVYEFEVVKGQLIMHMPTSDGDNQIVLHLIFNFDRSYSGTIEYPTEGGGSQGNTNIDFGDLGTQITYDQLMAAYNKRPQASFTHVEGEYICQPDNIVYSVILDCVDGEWVSNGELSLDISSLVISDYTMSSLGEAMSSSESTISFYQLSSNVYNILIENSYVRQLLTLNEFFYLTHQCSVYESTIYTIDVLWS